MQAILCFSILYYMGIGSSTVKKWLLDRLCSPFLLAMPLSDVDFCMYFKKFWSAVKYKLIKIYVYLLIICQKFLACFTHELPVKSKVDPHSTEYCRNMSEIFPIVHYNWNMFATFLSTIQKYFIATLQF